MPNLGAASIGGYMDFIQQMLGLRNQRLEEEKFKAAQKQEQMQQMMKMAGQVSNQIGGAFQGYQESQMANRLMQETYGAPPRAQAVDPSMQGPADLAAQRMPGFYTGGMPELKMRMGIAEDLSQANYRRAMINRMGQNYDLAREKFQVGQAAAAKKDIDKNLDQDVKNENWYLKENRVVDTAISKAQTPEDWQTAVDHKAAVNNAALKRGMKVEPFDPTKIAPFMSADERTTLENQQTAVSESRTALEEAKKAPLGLIDTTRQFLGLGTGSGALGLPGIPTQKEGAVQSATKLYEQEQQKLRETPGASFYGEKPVSKPEGELKEASPGGIPLGTIKTFRNKATGKPEQFKWNGSDWEPV